MIFHFDDGTSDYPHACEFDIREGEGGFVGKVWLPSPVDFETSLMDELVSVGRNFSLEQEEDFPRPGGVNLFPLLRSEKCPSDPEEVAAAISSFAERGRIFNAEEFRRFFNCWQNHFFLIWRHRPLDFIRHLCHRRFNRPAVVPAVNRLRHPLLTRLSALIHIRIL